MTGERDERIKFTLKRNCGKIVRLRLLLAVFCFVFE